MIQLAFLHSNSIILVKGKNSLKTTHLSSILATSSSDAPSGILGSPGSLTNAELGSLTLTVMPGLVEVGDGGSASSEKGGAGFGLVDGFGGWVMAVLPSKC